MQCTVSGRHVFHALDKAGKRGCTTAQPDTGRAQAYAISGPMGAWTMLYLAADFL